MPWPEMLDHWPTHCRPVSVYCNSFAAFFAWWRSQFCCRSSSRSSWRANAMLAGLPGHLQDGLQSVLIAMARLSSWRHQRWGRCLGHGPRQLELCHPCRLWGSSDGIWCYRLLAAFQRTLVLAVLNYSWLECIHVLTLSMQVDACCCSCCIADGVHMP